MTLKSKALLLVLLSLGCALLYEFWAFEPEFASFIVGIRTPKLLAMIAAAICIGAASLVFQTLIQNYIVTPCLLGMNALYLVLHTLLIFLFGLHSAYFQSRHVSFVCDLALMGLVATYLYSYLFVKTKYNVLYLLLIGTVLTTMFGSVQSALVRLMDPNEYDILLTQLVATFSDADYTLCIASFALMLIVGWFLREDLKTLDVIALGRDLAINLGLDYERSQKRLLLGVALYIAIATALVGPISFMGLITTNLARQFFVTYRHRYLTAGSVLFALIILIAGEFVIEQIFVYAIPISVFITISGGVYFLYLILRADKGSY